MQQFSLTPGSCAKEFKKMDISVACVIGMPPYKWNLPSERYGFCGNCEHEFGEGQAVFCNSFSKDGVEMHRFYCNRDCARYSERERLRPSLKKYLVLLQDWKDLLEEVLRVRLETPKMTHGTFSSSAECIAFVKLQRRIVLLVHKYVSSMLQRETTLNLLFKKRLQEEWGEMLASCVNDAMTLSTADEMKQFESLCVVARYVVEE